MDSTRKAIRRMLNESEFEFPVRGSQETSTVYLNPTRQEILSSSLVDKWNTLRAFIYPSGDLVVWQGVLHGEVRSNLPDWIKDLGEPISTYIYTEGSSNGLVVVTDYSRHTKWHHNPEVAKVIRGNKGIRQLFSTVDINYYDEAIVGDWEELDGDSRDA